MLKDFLSEIQGIMDSFPAYKIHVFSWDTEVGNPVQYDSDNLDSMVDYVPVGGGGTDVNCVYNYLKDQEIEPRRLVVFTDGHFFGSDGDPDYTDTVWIIFGNPGFTASHGVWAHYDDEKKK
jgi:predicted metal-dependent peptidase